MDRALLERLLGAVVLVLLFVVLVPALLDGRTDDGGKFEPVKQGERTALIVLEGGESRSAQEGAPPAQSHSSGKTPDVAGAKPKPAARPSADAPVSGFAVQLGSFSSRDNAVGFAGSVQSSGYPVFVVRGAADAGQVYRVYAGPKDSRTDAEQLAERLAREGQSVMVVDLGSRNE